MIHRPITKVIKGNYLCTEKPDPFWRRPLCENVRYIVSKKFFRHTKSVIGRGTPVAQPNSKIN
jgi:hypothetical protein